MRLAPALLALIGWLSATGAEAGPPISDFKKLREANENFSDVYLSGVLDGMTWMSAASTVMKGKPVYCAPPKLVITPEQALRIMDDYTTEHKPDPTDDSAFVLLKALADTFPCNGA